MAMLSNGSVSERSTLIDFTAGGGAGNYAQNRFVLPGCTDYQIPPY